MPFVVALTPYLSESLLQSADLLLPIGTFAETSGTYVNVAGTMQSFGGVANPVAEARPAWKVLRVLGNLLEVADFDYVSSEEVLQAAELAIGTITGDNAPPGSVRIAKPNGEDAPRKDIDVPMYSVDAVVRRATALQRTPEARRAAGGSGVTERKAS
jgi:NADH-quinone oxidoreductase subunit G